MPVPAPSVANLQTGEEGSTAELKLTRSEMKLLAPTIDTAAALSDA